MFSINIWILGGDDGCLNVWDLRKFESKTPLATFKHHTEPVVSVEWHPTDSAVFASAGADNQISLWDLSVEKDSDGDNEDLMVMCWLMILEIFCHYDIMNNKIFATIGKP